MPASHDCFMVFTFRYLPNVLKAIAKAIHVRKLASGSSLLTDNAMHDGNYVNDCTQCQPHIMYLSFNTIFDVETFRKVPKMLFRLWTWF